MSARIITAIVVLLSLLSSNAMSDQSALEQPGTNIESKVKELVTAGSDLEQSVSSILAELLTEDSSLLNGQEKSIVARDLKLSGEFLVEMVTTNNLISSVKVLMEKFPQDAIQTLTLAVTLYPEQSKEIYQGALMANVISEDDLFIAAVQAGIDPTEILDNTAAPGSTLGKIVPLGVGIGAAGTGGGETTASSN